MEETQRVSDDKIADTSSSREVTKTGVSMQSAVKAYLASGFQATTTFSECISSTEARNYYQE